MTAVDALPWVLSAQTLAAMWVAGQNPRVGWLFALVGQVTWTAYTFYAHAWGFLPLNIGLTAVYFRNLRLQKCRS